MTNPPKLELEYPCIKIIKMRLKNSDDVSIDQVKGLDRRIRNSPLLRIIIHYAHQQQHRATNYRDKYNQVKKELDRIESTPYMNLQRENERLLQENEDLKAQLKKLNPSYSSA